MKLYSDAAYTISCKPGGACPSSSRQHRNPAEQSLSHINVISWHVVITHAIDASVCLARQLSCCFSKAGSAHAAPAPCLQITCPMRPPHGPMLLPFAACRTIDGFKPHISSRSASCGNRSLVLRSSCVHCTRDFGRLKAQNTTHHLETSLRHYPLCLSTCRT